MSLFDQARRLRIRESALYEEALDNRPDFLVGSPCLLVRTKTLITYPNVAQCFYACEPLSVLGLEIEGGFAMVASSSATIFALNLGTTVPPPGSQIIATFVENRWVFRYDA